MTDTEEQQVCSGKRKMTRSQAMLMSKRRGLRFYRCTVDNGQPHFHVTSVKRHERLGRG